AYRDAARARARRVIVWNRRKTGGIGVTNRDGGRRPGCMRGASEVCCLARRVEYPSAHHSLGVRWSKAGMYSACQFIEDAKQVGNKRRRHDVILQGTDLQLGQVGSPKGKVQIGYGAARNCRSYAKRRATTSCFFREGIQSDSWVY